MSEKLIPHGHSYPCVRAVRAGHTHGHRGKWVLSRVECQLGRKSKMRCRTGACMCGCGHETGDFACPGGDSTLLYAATAGLKRRLMTRGAGNIRRLLARLCPDEHSALLYLPALLSVSLHRPCQSRGWTMEN
ncbi:hypothetical protein fugu_007246 [Takifugu bimaculatus]|uniref:Uncharacterized protein n=1 Tax=Takifugu bimaculatus TaxID=433685 RepID=A0A4Z2B5W7_9TELE|nr:hypothetical protein fugu_007246 [Takifugu bimaculatus]